MGGMGLPIVPNIYRANFRHPAVQADLNDPATDAELAKWRPDLIFGGPPCQDFSIAGKRTLGERANLTIRYAEIVSKLRPEWFVMENVYNIERMPILPSVHEPSSTIRSVNRPIPENYKRHPADKADVSSGVRALTTKEHSFIQTFPESFQFPGAKSDVERAIGNAVPVKLAEYVARTILNLAKRNRP